ncbi:efflux RND transporter permease subunit [Flavobacterium sp. TR2]|uniref:efflux RND transporter permease subunit n=1 Tax=Flavobacterium sp. TR2 TaxID=2977321 RepID=UPI0021B099DD|nr:efflux RND transporter permease subunit [Flavobacterium sp. TR2]UWY27327.1 efflux RND transporter permease subunit [Flavobacterium sp. TR2]
MKAKKPSEMSIEELLKMQKTIKTTIKILILAAIMLLIIIVFLFLEKGLLSLMAIPFSMAFLIVNSNFLKEIQQEIATRNLN